METELADPDGETGPKLSDGVALELVGGVEIKLANIPGGETGPELTSWSTESSWSTVSLLDGESLQNSAEAPSRPSLSQRTSTSGLLLVSMATSLMLLPALSSFFRWNSAWKERALSWSLANSSL